MPTLKEVREMIERLMGESDNVAIHGGFIPSHLDLSPYFKITKEPFGFIKFEKINNTTKE